MKKIPFLIQRTFLKIPKEYTLSTEKESLYHQKELEKKLKLDYKNKRFIVFTTFNEQKDKT